MQLRAHKNVNIYYTQFCQVLVKVLTAGTKFSKKSEVDKKKKKERRLRRPIICICNDPWGVALRDLRKVATIITVPPTQSARLATRLKTICTVEALTADMASLLFLCEKTDNDIRLALWSRVLNLNVAIWGVFYIYCIYWLSGHKKLWKIAWFPITDSIAPNKWPILEPVD